MGYAISGGHEVTVRVAEDVLKSGGNAFDAAVAGYLAAFVAEPCMSSAGAGFVALLKSGNNKMVSLDAFCQTPKEKRKPKEDAFYPIDVDFGSTQERFYIGIGAAATPGAIAGLFHLNTHYGRMDFRELAQPAIRLAKEGIGLNEFQAYDLHLLRNILGAKPAGQEIFCSNGQIKKEGDSIQMLQFADFLDVLSYEGNELFYKGEIAQTIVDLSDELGGNFTMQDFEDFRVRESEVLSFPIQDIVCLTSSYPSVGGSILLSFLNQLAGRQNNAKNIIEAYEYCLPLMQNLAQLSIEISRLLNRNIDLQGPKKYGGTSHFNILDADGNAIALSTTIGEGCGEMIPGTDMQLNNMLGEMALLPDGLHSWKPDRRLISMMSPTMLMDTQGGLKAVLGTGGAGRIPFMIAQVIQNYLEGQAITQVVKQARMHIAEGVLHAEPNYDLDSHEGGMPINQWNKQSLYFGGVHSIFVQGEELHAFGDDRRHGYAVVG